MDVLFDDANVKDLVLDLEDVTVIKKKITKVLSKDTSRKLKLRLDQLKAAPSFQWLIDNPIGHFESLTGDFNHKYSLRLDANYRLIIRPDSSDYTRDALSKCTKYYLVGVVDYHGNKRNWLIP